MKKSLLIILSLVLVLSLLINIRFIFIYMTYIFPEENRAKNFYTQMNAFKSNGRNLFDYEKQYFANDQRPDDLNIFDSTFDELNLLQMELITTSGGLNVETGVVMNTSSRYVKSYFYEENPVRPNAVEYFVDVLQKYINEASHREIDSKLKSQAAYYLKVKDVPIFSSLTVPESIVILDEMIWLVYLDRLNYVSSNYDCIPD